MREEVEGLVTKGIGGLYTVRRADGTELSVRARGLFRHEKSTVLPGDRVKVAFEEGKKEAGYVIFDILPRKNELLRPAIANTDLLFIVFSPVSPIPNLAQIDKMIAIAVYKNIRPIVVITKADLEQETAKTLYETYKKAGITAFLCSSEEKRGTEEILSFIKGQPKGALCVFAGASGVGKSSLLNTLFPALGLATGSVSEKTERGRHTTRAASLFEMKTEDSSFFVADTPGFSLLDFVNFDYFGKDDLVFTFPEFESRLGSCRWLDCTHTKEEGCAIREAVERGEIAASRYESFRIIYDELRVKPDWERNKK